MLKYFDDDLLDKLFGFCYARTKDSYEAEELCSDIRYELVKAANTVGKIADAYPFIWRVARNVYADISTLHALKSTLAANSMYLMTTGFNLRSELLMTLILRCFPKQRRNTLQKLLSAAIYIATEICFIQRSS